MKKISLVLFLAFLLGACDGTYVTKNVIDSRTFEFLHANKVKKILIELKEIRTMTRTNGIFRPGPMSKNVSYGYAVYATLTDGRDLIEIYEYPCDKSIDLDDFLLQMRVKRSKQREHFAIGYQNQTMAIFHSMRKVSFLADYPLNPSGFTHDNFDSLNFQGLETPRLALKNHISGKAKLLISDKDLHDILVQLPANDELNYELSFSIANEDMFRAKNYQESIIKHCSKDPNWKNNALTSIKNKKDDLSNEQFLTKLYAIGGMPEVIKEDEYQYTLFLSNGNLDYFKQRMANTNIALQKSTIEKLKKDLSYILQHPCEMTSSEIGQMEDYFAMCEDLGIKNPFGLFFSAYQKASCLKTTLHDFNNEFLFPSPVIGESDKRLWVDFAFKNFKAIPQFNRSWDYKSLEQHLSCEQKRDLLTKYKKDIDSFGDMVVPICR